MSIWLVALVILAAASPAFAREATNKEYDQFVDFYVAALLSLKDVKRGRELCGEAKKFAARFDPNEYWLGVIEDCDANIAMLAGDKKTACAALQRAIAHMNKVPARYKDDAKASIQDVRKNLASC